VLLRCGSCRYRIGTGAVQSLTRVNEAMPAPRHQGRIGRLRPRMRRMHMSNYLIQAPSLLFIGMVGLFSAVLIYVSVTDALRH
jgi:hypothetical protein